MKQIVVLITACLLFLGCSSDDKTTVFDPNVNVNGQNLEIKDALKHTAVYENVKQTQFAIGYTVSCPKCTRPEYKRIILNIKTGVSDGIEGTYDLSEPENETRFMSGGYYVSGYPISFYSGTVTVSKLGSNRYKLEFNSVKGWFWIDHSSPTAIDGYFDGDFTEIDQAIQN